MGQREYGSETMESSVKKITIDMDDYLVAEIIINELKNIYCLHRDDLSDDKDSKDIMNACIILLDYYMCASDYLKWLKDEDVK